MLTAQNNQPDEKGQGQSVAKADDSQLSANNQASNGNVQIDPDLQRSIDQITQDLAIEASYEDSGKVLSQSEAEQMLVVDPKNKINNVSPPTSSIEAPRLDQVSVNVNQSVEPSSPAVTTGAETAPSIPNDPVTDDQLPSPQSMPADLQLDDVQSVANLNETPVGIAASEIPVDLADGQSAEFPKQDDLGIAEPVFSQSPENGEAITGEAETEEAETGGAETTSLSETDSSLETGALPKVTLDSSADIENDEIIESSNETIPPLNTRIAVNANFAPTNSFFDILLNQGTITLEQAEEIRQENLSSGRSFEELLTGKQLATETEIVQAKAEFNNVPYIKLSTIGVDPEALNLIDEGNAKRYQALPFSVDKDRKLLKIAMINPLDLAAIEFLKQKTGFNIEAYYSEGSEISRMIDDHYAQSLSSEVTAALKSTAQQVDNEGQSVQLDQQGAILRDAPINRIVENILDFAIKASASDIHIEPQINRTRVRYRIDGILSEKLILPKNVHDAVVSRIKIMANLKIDEKRLPQDGRFNYKTNKAEIDLRTSTLPTTHGEKVVMRLLQKNMAVPSLEDLGLTGLGLQRLKEAIKIPYGIILITGPTGSGKTTTLYSILNIINKVGVNIMTLEDPVEYQIPGVSQVQTNPKAGLTFASGLRSFLRQDPDIIMVGEIRDNETADLALQASLTGHMVFSTLHTNSAAGALPRLLDMETESFLLASSITLSMGQRVVRRINEKYKEEYKPEPIVIEDIKKVLGVHFDRWCKDNKKKPDEIKLFKPSKQRPVTEPEYKGRIGIFEIMPTSPEISSLILNRKPASEIEKTAIQQGMILMKQDGYLKVLDGITTIEEVLRVAEVG
jgi:type IV pilus assembly protein PilB